MAGAIVSRLRPVGRRPRTSTHAWGDIKARRAMVPARKNHRAQSLESPLIAQRRGSIPASTRPFPRHATVTVRYRVTAGLEVVVGGVLVIVGASLVALTRQLVPIGQGLVAVARRLRSRPVRGCSIFGLFAHRSSTGVEA